MIKQEIAQEIVKGPPVGGAEHPVPDDNDLLIALLCCDNRTA